MNKHAKGFALIRTGDRYVVLNQTLAVIAKNTGFATPQAMTEAMITRVATLCIEGMSEIAAHDQVVAEVVTRFKTHFQTRLAQMSQDDAKYP